MRTALIQLNSSDDPVRNLVETQALIESAASQGAGFVLTPEVTNCVSASRTHQKTVLATEAEDATLHAICDQARDLGIWCLLGSVALRSDDPDGRFANRSFLIGPDGEVRARYDKIHMFDVQVSETETYRESAGYRPGEALALVDTGFAQVGLTVCYDLRFPRLYRTLAQAGAQVITVPSAFSPVTGAAHWHALLRARAIENGCYILAPAQCGTHAAQRGRSRSTYGHSLAVAPWGEVLVEGGDAPGVHIFEIDAKSSDNARRKIPALTHDAAFTGP